MRWERAVANVAARARRESAGAERRLIDAVGEPVASAMLDRMPSLPQTARLTVNFHPDRLAAGGVTVAEGVTADGRYRSQWSTWISSGGRTATSGGDRERWETALFGDAYAGADPAEHDMPVYGALDLLHDPHGGSPRFGSCFLVLAPHVFERTTMTVGDSHASPRDVGTLTEPTCLLAGLAEQAAAGQLLGRALGIADLVAALDGTHASSAPARLLDHYVEAQIHGGLHLEHDVRAVVLDPSFRGTVVDERFAAASQRYGFHLAWHAGSQLHVDDVPADFRGPSMPALARLVAAGGDLIDARAIGAAAARIAPQPPTATGDAAESDLQQLKYLWHTLLAFGSDAAR